MASRSLARLYRDVVRDWVDDDLLDNGPSPPWWRQVLGWVATGIAAVGLVQVVGALRAPDLPDHAPDFALVDLDGEEVALSSLRGQTVVLNFWATWCGPCRIEAPSFASFAEANPDIAVVGIAADGTPARVRATARELGISYPVLLADDGVLEDYSITTFPTTVIVGPDGGVRAAHTGLLFRPQLALLARM